MQEQFKYRYFIDGKEIDTREEYFNTTMSGDYVSYFDGDSVFSVSFNSFFGENKDNNKMIKREVNGHLSDAINSRLQLSKKINEESLEKYKSLFKRIDTTQYNTLDLCQIKGSSTRHKSQNGEAHKEVVGHLEGINKPPKTEQLDYQSFYQVVYTKPTSNWNKFEITFSDNDLEKIKGLSIGDIKEMFNSTISAEQNKTEENLVFQKDSEIHKEELKPDFTFTSTPKEINDAVNDARSDGVNEGVKRNNEGVKESNGKTDYSEIDWQFIESMALRMNKNKGKYEAGNYKKPMDIDLLKQSLLRHTIEVLKGNYEDDGDDLGHLSAIALNAQFLYYQLKNNVK